MRLSQKHRFIKLAVCACSLMIAGLCISTLPVAAVNVTGGGPGSSEDSSTSNEGSVYTCANGSPAPLNNKDNCQTGGPHCGDSPGIRTSINIGCEGKGNPVMDMLFAIIRFLSMGVGIVVVASLIVAGVQYSASGGDPNAAKTAMHRIRSSLIALLIFIFAYAILNYVIPGAVLG